MGGKNSFFNNPLGEFNPFDNKIKKAAKKVGKATERAVDTAAYGSNPAEVGGKAGQFLSTGKKRGEELTGVSSQDVGKERADIRQRYKDILGGESIAQKVIKQDLATRQRQARAQAAVSGASQVAPAQLQAMQRQASADLATARSKEYMNALNKLETQFRGAAGDIARIEGQYGAIGVGGQPAPQMSSSNFFGTVICTELHKQGYMSDEILEKDAEYGMQLRSTRPEVYVGYRFLANPIVRLMQKSPMFTKIISIPALKWADNMAGKHNITGKLISQIGELVCGFVGKLLNNKSRRII